jgi:molybdate transport system substrate-binding protein
VSRVLKLRWISLLAGCAVAAIALPACASTQSAAQADTLTVFAAASLKNPFEKLERAYESRYPQTAVVLATAGSSTLARQLIDGASVDVFASASSTQIQQVAAAGLLVADPDTFASNEAIPVRSLGSPVTDLSQFGDDRYRIALCAQAVPCGQAADQLLDRADVATPNASRETDVLAVAGKVASGEADAGVVYASDLQHSDGRLTLIESPNVAPVTSQYEIAILKSARDNPSAADWVALVTGPVGQAVLRDAGFGPAQSSGLADG